MSDLNDFLKKLPLDWKDPVPQPDPLAVARSAREKLPETDLTPYYSVMDAMLLELAHKQQLPPSLMRRLNEETSLPAQWSAPVIRDETSLWVAGYSRPPLPRRLLNSARRLFLSLRTR